MCMEENFDMLTVSSGRGCLISVLQSNNRQISLTRLHPCYHPIQTTMAYLGGYNYHAICRTADCMGREQLKPPK